ncbi:hypothetical protein [Algisphaera agarilytica]|uniref:Uncharacterized protein n=1 Tax=Algisphaera agarilytica TaxID=1385975 RepID=A0A7X0LKV6_9BACT|nr:hypothetical protein [Algisphaera agarilytica]MBB6430845.1 hypothetical protein [Algisphaera agarilytica]
MSTHNNACAAFRPVSTGTSSSSANFPNRFTAYTRSRDSASCACSSANTRTPATARRVSSDPAHLAICAGDIPNRLAVFATSSTPPSMTSNSSASRGSVGWAPSTAAFSEMAPVGNAHPTC